MATPALTALLWHGSFPPLKIVVPGLIAAFAGYTAVYALNDLVDYRVDKQRADNGLFPDHSDDLDSIFIRHPLAYGLLSFRKALLWTLGWALLALAGSYFLNPICALIFLAASLLEAIYCIMWKSNYLKIIISGAVKTSGALAAVFAVDPSPSPLLLAILFLWLFFWEIGGQNLPNDWADIEEDRLLQAATIPVRFGPAFAVGIIVLALLISVVLNGFLLGFSPVKTHYAGLAASFGAGIYLLLIPAFRLCRTKDRRQALALFNSASYYPVALLAIVIMTIIT